MSQIRTIKIEKNIPLPKYTKMPSKDSLVEDLKKMKPLESRLIDIDFNDKNLNAVRTRIHGIIKRENIKGEFTVGKDPISNSKLRVWRKA